jgi:hypothetical protein
MTTLPNGEFVDASVAPDDQDPLASYYVGGTITGDIISPIVPYEDYTFDENNICPEEYAKRQAASNKKD